MLVFVDGYSHQKLKPFTWTRPVADLRLGIFTLAQKWQHYIDMPFGFLTESYLQDSFPITKQQATTSYTYIDASILPNKQLCDSIVKLTNNQALLNKDQSILALKTQEKLIDTYILEKELAPNFEKKHFSGNIQKIQYAEDFIKLNASEITKDFNLKTTGKISNQLSKSNHLLGEDLFLEQNIFAECCTFNTLNGPIYIEKNATIMEGSHLRGPLYIGENAIIKMASKIYGGTSIGRFCTVGGEIKNSIFWGYSNKGHDGYIGDSMIGAWCNFGAGSCNSNMKNTLGTVKLWDYETEQTRDTQMQFCGLMMGDYSTTKINTSFNTGTVVGICCNIIDDSTPPTFIPDFTWGNEEYKLEKALENIQRLINLKKDESISLNKVIFNHIFYNTKKLRKDNNNHF